MECFVQSFLFRFFRDTDGQEAVDHLQDQPCDGKGIDAGKYGCAELDQELVNVSFDQAADAIDRGSCEHAGQDGSQNAAYAVNTPYVQRVVPAPAILKLNRIVTYDTSSETDDDC